MGALERLAFPAGFTGGNYGKNMSKSFRSGPWRVLSPYTGTSSYPIGVDRGDGATDIIGEFNGQGGVGDEMTANARLAASAPELLAALSALVNGEITLSSNSSALYSKGDFKGFLSEHCPKVIAARAAIAKAISHAA